HVVRNTNVHCFIGKHRKTPLGDLFNSSDAIRRKDKPLRLSAIGCDGCKKCDVAYGCQPHWNRLSYAVPVVVNASSKPPRLPIKQAALVAPSFAALDRGTSAFEIGIGEQPAGT